MSKYENVDIEGKITAVKDKKSLNRKSDNKVVIVQECTIKIDGKLFTLNFWDHKEDMKQYLLKQVVVKKVTLKQDNTYSGGFWSEVDDRFTENEDDTAPYESDPNWHHMSKKEVTKEDITKALEDPKNITFIEPKTYRVLVGRAANYAAQKVEFETTITGTLEDAAREFDNMNKLAYIKLQGMLE